MNGLGPLYQIARVFVAAGPVINPGVLAGQHAIINTRASIDHDCVLGAYVQVAPGATRAAVYTLAGLVLASMMIVAPHLRHRILARGSVTFSSAIEYFAEQEGQEIFTSGLAMAPFGASAKYGGGPGSV